jgi:hypothetical protein
MPERRLMLAILTDAIECFQKYSDAKSSRQRTLSADARAWLMTRNERYDRETRKQFSFEYICDVLDLDAGAVRDRLQRWERRQRYAPSEV